MSDKGHTRPVAPEPAKVKRIRCHPVRDQAVTDFHVAASLLWSVHMATANGQPAYDPQALVAMTEAMLQRVWLDGHTHGTFNARRMEQKP